MLGDAIERVQSTWIPALVAMTTRIAWLIRAERDRRMGRSSRAQAVRVARSDTVKPLSRMFSATLIGALLSWITLAHADPVPVRFAEGVTRGFLVLRTLQGADIAAGDLSQVVRGDRVSRRLLFRFKDGSIQDESVVFSQRGTFRLLSDHLIQKGASFPQPLDVTINTASGQVDVRYIDDGGEKVASERMTIPPDVANGLLPTLLRNIARSPSPTNVSFVAATPKPRLVKLEISPEGEDPFSAGGVNLKATRYVVKVKIGGIAGVVAPLLDKQPPDSHVWVVGGDAPSFVKAETPLYNGGPMVRIELTSPGWP
jgi:hypothetical protein